MAHYLHLVVERRRWLDEAQFLEGVALCQLLPGPNMGNLAVYLGQRLAGLAGSILGLLAIIGPGALFLILLGSVYSTASENPFFQRALLAVGPAAIGVITASTIRVAPGIRSSRAAIPIAVVTFMLLGVARVPLHWTLLIVAPFAIWTNRPGTAQ